MLELPFKHLSSYSCGNATHFFVENDFRWVHLECEESLIHFALNSSNANKKRVGAQT